MRYSLEPKYRKYVKENHLLENLEINMVKSYWVLQQNLE